MAVTVTKKDAKTGIANSVTTVSITTVAGNSYVIASFSSTAAASISSGAGLTWVKNKSVATTNEGFVSLWTATCTTPGTSTFTITYGSGNDYFYDFIEITGATSTVIKQSVTGSGTSNSKSLTLAAGANAVYMGILVFGTAGSTTVTPETGYTQLSSLAQQSDDRFTTAWNSSFDSTPSFTYAGFASDMFALEFDAAAPPGPAAFGASPIVGSLMRMGFGI